MIFNVIVASCAANDLTSNQSEGVLGVQYFGTYFREETFSCFLPRVSILPFQPPIILSWNIAILSGKYEARIAIFRIFAAVDRFSRISWKVESR
jgi:hypothetical protein